MPISSRAAPHRSDSRPTSAGWVRLRLESGPRSVAVARSGTGRALRAWRLSDDDIAIAQLLVSELVTDAVEQAVTAVTVDLQRGADQVRIAVTGSHWGPGRLADPADQADDAAGRRRVVSVLASRWGRATVGAERRTWVELDVAPDRLVAAAGHGLGSACSLLLDALLPQRGALANARTAVELNRRSAGGRRAVALAMTLAADSSPGWELYPVRGPGQEGGASARGLAASGGRARP